MDLATSTPQERGKSQISWAPVAGAGIEWKVRPNLSFRVEGLYYWNRGAPNPTQGGFVKIKNTAVFRVGASWYY